MSRTAAAPMPSDTRRGEHVGLYAALDRIAVEGWDGPTAHRCSTTRATTSYGRRSYGPGCAEPWPTRRAAPVGRSRGRCWPRLDRSARRGAWSPPRSDGPSSARWLPRCTRPTPARPWRLRAKPTAPPRRRPDQPLGAAGTRLGSGGARCGARSLPGPGPIAAAMVTAGWDRTRRALVLQWVASRAGSTRPGWRVFAARSGMPPWRARRATVLLMGPRAGVGSWSGLCRRGRRRAAAAGPRRGDPLD